MSYMNRRDLLKSGLLIAGATMLSGCNGEKESDKELTIVPKQTDVYKLSVPMVFNFEAIDDFAKWNSQYKKSKVETLYNSIPWPLSEPYNEWIQLCRGGSNSDIKTFDDFAKYVKHSINNGFKVCYLMNSPKPFNFKDLDTFKNDFYKLLDKLWNIGIDNIKVANTQVAVLINEHNPEFKLSASTIFEYNSITQYVQLLELYPNFVNFGIAKNQNQNFRFLKNMKKHFPNITIEMMMDEGCIKNCPTRTSCMSCSSTSYFKNGCKLTKQNQYKNRIRNGCIQPWELSYYSAIGINNFKITPQDQRASDKHEMHVKYYMDIVEYGLYSKGGKKLLEAMFPNIKPENRYNMISYLPDIEYFIKHGHECDSRCGVECNYCDILEKRLKNAMLNG